MSRAALKQCLKPRAMSRASASAFGSALVFVFASNLDLDEEAAGEDEEEQQEKKEEAPLNGGVRGYPRMRR